MTATRNPEMEAWSKINTSFTKAENELFTDRIDASNIARARGGGLLKGVIDGIGNAIDGIGSAAKDVADDFWRGYGRTSPVYARSGNVYGGSLVSDVTGDVWSSDYDVNTTLNSYIDAKPAKQSWLQYVTGKVKEYVFGAAIDRGEEEEGTYIDEGLYENAEKYVSNFWRGLKDKARKYAKDFVEAVVTDGHEYGHYELGIKNEPGAEAVGVRKLNNYLEAGDPAVRFAVANAA